MKMNRFQKSLNQKVPLDRAIISDLLLWAFLAALLAYGLYFFAVAMPAKRGQTIHLAFLNANEISRGAPVRLMGTDIGFVDNIRIEQDHVDVTIQTDPDAIRIPSGSVFTVLFTGLGGAKSIEVTLPSAPEPDQEGQPVYHVREPISMRDTLNASLDTVQALQKGSENISDFFGKRKPVEELQFNIQQSLKMSSSATQNMIHLNTALGTLQQDANTYTRQAIQTFQRFNNGAKQLNTWTQPNELRPKLITINQNLDRFHQALVHEGTLAHHVTLGLNRTHQHALNLSNRLSGWQQRLSVQPLPRWLQDIEQGHTVLDSALNALEQHFPAGKSLPLPAIRHQIQGINGSLRQWHGFANWLEQQGVLHPPPGNTRPSANQEPSITPRQQHQEQSASWFSADKAIQTWDALWGVIHFFWS